jgi:TldD protein
MKKKNNYSKFSIAIFIVFALLITTTLFAQAQENQVVFKALADELSRTMEKLQMENLDKPYYVSYMVREFQVTNISASFGSISESKDDFERYLTVDLRVGNYDLDNSNFLSDYRSLNPNQSQIPLEDDYSALRHTIWLATDGAYKNALEELSRKKAYIQTKTITDLPSDFAKVTPYSDMGTKAILQVDKTKWEKTVQELSKILTAYPKLNDSKVLFAAQARNRYFLNSEGSQNRQGDLIFLLEVYVSTQAKDGDNIFNFLSYYSRTPEELPGFEKLVADVKELAEKTEKFAQAEKITEYSGPILFTGQAAGEFFRQIFCGSLSEPRSPLAGNDAFADMVAKPALANKVGTRIVAPFISIVDDPNLDKWGNSPLIGGYKVDDEGVLAQKAQLVDKGKLVGLWIGRAPTKKVAESNGHSRGALERKPGGRPSNLIISSDEKVPYLKLKEKLLEYCRDSNLEYGIIITKLRDRNFYLDTDPNTYSYGRSQTPSLLPEPIEAYKIYVKDGHEEPIRGIEFEGITVRILKDIALSGDDNNVYNYLIGHNDEMPASIVAPSLLVEEVELKKAETKPSKPPILESPFSKK